MLILYPIGIPVFLIGKLYLNRLELTTPNVKAQLGFLYDGYHLEFWWFEMVDMFHKLFQVTRRARPPARLAGLPHLRARARRWRCSPSSPRWRSCSWPWPSSSPTTSSSSLWCGPAPRPAPTRRARAHTPVAQRPYVRKSDDRLHLLANTEIFLLLLSVHVFAHEVGVDSVMDGACQRTRLPALPVLTCAPACWQACCLPSSSCWRLRSSDSSCHSSSTSCE
jgi:hypothetical protein